jgi:hypothetical protein
VGQGGGCSGARHRHAIIGGGLIDWGWIFDDDDVFGDDKTIIDEV